jgi:hypothetical protein
MKRSEFWQLSHQDFKDYRTMAGKGIVMDNNDLFVLDEYRTITDLHHPSLPAVYYRDGEPEDHTHLRETVLLWRLDGLLRDLLVNRQQAVMDQLLDTLVDTVRASRFVAISPAPSIHTKLDGSFTHEKRRLQDSTSLSLFCDDVCSLLRDLFGHDENGALHDLRSALLKIMIGSSCCILEDLSAEHTNAAHVDLHIGPIGWPTFLAKHRSYSRIGCAALHALRIRTREVHEDPYAFSRYSVRFAEKFASSWRTQADQNDQARQVTALAS